VVFDATSLEALSPLVRHMDYPSTNEGWHIVTWMYEGPAEPVVFVLLGPPGDYAGADRIARAITESMESSRDS